VVLRGATFGSMGDGASKETGGGIVSANVEGPTRFVGPGAMNVKMERKNVQLLGNPMLNNCGPSGSPANAATLMGLIQVSGWRLTAVTGEKVKPRSFGHRGSVPPCGSCNLILPLMLCTKDKNQEKKCQRRPRRAMAPSLGTLPTPSPSSNR